MHIADITMFYAPHSGGVRTYLRAKHQRLADLAGTRHSILVPGRRRSDDDGVHTLPAPPIPFGQGYRFPIRKSPWRNRLVELAPDIIEAGDPYRLPWAALDAGQRLGVPVIGFYHSDLPRLIRARYGRACGRLAERYVRRLYPHFDLVLAPSRTMAGYLASIGIPRVAVQPLGVDIRQFHPRMRDPQLRRELGIPNHRKLLIFAGRNACEKNLPLLLDAMKRLGSDYHLLLIGPGMPTHQLPENVSVYSHYHQASRLARLLASSDALIHAGTQETFGLVVLEAMASGVPVIGIDAGAVAELVEPATGILADQASAAALADAARQLFTRDLHAMGRAARRYVEVSWSWDRVFERLFTHYAGLGKTVSPEVLSPMHAAR